jgi:isocitrate lyase
MLAYNCSPSFNWKKNLDDATIAKFQKEIASYGYKFQFITLAGFHSLNYSMFNLAYGYARNQIAPSSSCRKPSSPLPSAASLRSSTSAKSARVTSTR